MNHATRMPGRFNDRAMAMMGIPDLPEAAFGGDLPPHQRTALVRAMGIKPQGGGGGGLMKVVAIAAAIAIPMAAPAIASSIGLSAGIAAATGMSAVAASTVGSAMVGAALGGTLAKVQGGSFAQGALMGGIGGGISGYMAAPAPYSGSGLTPPSSTGGGLGLSSPTAPAPSLAGSPGLGSGLGMAPVDYSLTASMPTSGGFGINPAGGGFGLDPNAASQVGLQYGGTTTSGLSEGLSSSAPVDYSMGSGTGTTTAGTSTNYGAFGEAPGTATTTAGSGATGVDYSLTSASTAPSTTTAAATEWSGTGLKVPQSMASTTSLNGVDYSLAGAGTSGAGAGTTAANTAKNLTFSQALAKVPEAIAKKFTDPAALADLTMRAGAQLITGQMADAGLSDEEKQLLQARVDEMKQNKEMNNELFNTQLREAYDLLGRSDYFDPSYFGAQYANQAKQRVSAQKESALRKMNPRNKASRLAEERRYNLASGREEATAYDKGSMYGFDAGLKLTQQALNALPKNAPSSSADATALSTAYSNIEERKRKSQEGLNKTFGGTLFGQTA
jgi:hypothetical protein